MSDVARRARNAAEARETTPAGDLTGMIRGMQGEFQAAMPQGSEAVQLVRDAMTCLRQTPALADCDAASILGGLMTCAQLGLRPGVLGQAYLVPFKSGDDGRFYAQLIIGYQGLSALAWRSGMLTGISGRVVHERDEFRVVLGLREDLIHTPYAPIGPGDTAGSAVAYYVVLKFLGGATHFEYAYRAEIEAHRDKYARGAAKASSPWVTAFDQMALKTLIRRAMKRAPIDTKSQLASAITADHTVRLRHSPGAAIDDEARPAIEAAE